MVKPALAAAALTVLVAGLSGCAKRGASQDVEKKVNQTLSAQVGKKVKAKCPGKLEAKKGKSYVCTVVAADGSRMRIRVRMLDDTGKFDFQGAGGGTVQ